MTPRFGPCAWKIAPPRSQPLREWLRALAMLAAIGAWGWLAAMVVE